MIKKELKGFNINIDDIETINFENGMLQQIARKCAEEYDLKRLELVLNGNIITAKDKFTGINSYMGMRVSLEPLEKDISFIIRPTNKPTYDELQQENKKLNGAIQTYDILLKTNAEENKRLKDNWNKLNEYIKTEIPEDVFINTEWFVSILDKMQEIEQKRGGINE